MKERQLRRLAELSLADRITAVSEGLELIARNVRAQSGEIENIHEIAPRASLLLKTLAEEEAAKAFLLVDYLRPPLGTSAEAVAAHLGRVYDHMTRGVYAFYYSTRPASFGEVKEIVEGERVSLYLDGPEGFEWIFRNQIMQRREELMYVDWIEVEGEMRWQSPDYRVRLEEGMPAPRSMIIRMLLAMEGNGLLKAGPLSRLRDVWSTKELSSDTHWVECSQANREFLNAVAAEGLEISEQHRAMVESSLLFPLTGLDTSTLRIDRRTLEEERDEAVRNWHPW